MIEFVDNAANDIGHFFEFPVVKPAVESSVNVCNCCERPFSKARSELWRRLYHSAGIFATINGRNRRLSSYKKESLGSRGSQARNQYERAPSFAIWGGFVEGRDIWNYRPTWNLSESSIPKLVARSFRREPSNPKTSCRDVLLALLSSNHL